MGCTYLDSPNCDYCDELDDLTHIVVTYSRLSGIFQLTKALIVNEHQLLIKFQLHLILLLSGETSTDDIEQICIVKKGTFLLLKQQACELWFQYMQMVELVRKFIIAVRLGDWDLTLKAYMKCYPSFQLLGIDFT